MSARVSELVLDRWDEEQSEETEREQAGMEVFRLSGGVMGPATRTSNRIDDLLVRMLAYQGSNKYLGDIDKNLDYLYTSLQLDLIGRVADDVASREALERVDEDVAYKEEVEVQQDLPEPVLSLDRVRSSV